MAFHIINNRTGKTFDILESRKSNDLRNFFINFSRKQRLKVKSIIMDMFDFIINYLNLFFLMLL